MLERSHAHIGQFIKMLTRGALGCRAWPRDLFLPSLISKYLRIPQSIHDQIGSQNVLVPLSMFTAAYRDSASQRARYCALVQVHYLQSRCCRSMRAT